MSKDALTLAETWHELVTVGLLGTDRRDPPALPSGPLADTVADALRPTPQGRLLTAVAATVVARRCGATPLPPSPALLPPESDDRPTLPPCAAVRWHRIVTDWPVLEAEWLAVAAAAGWRPAPDILVAMLRRHRRSPLLAGAVLAWGGARAAWLVDHVPDLAPSDSQPPPPRGELRPLPVPAELELLLHGAGDELAATLVAGLASGAYRWSHRAVLLNVVARVDPLALPTVIAALRAGRDHVAEADDDAAPLSMWEAMIELAEARGEMLAELKPSSTTTGTRSAT
jgi:hypothetical protein